MKRLEGLRLELDSRRRTVSDLQARCERARASLGATRSRGEVELELSLRKMQHKEDKMQREFGGGAVGRSGAAVQHGNSSGRRCGIGDGDASTGRHASSQRAETPSRPAPPGPAPRP
jgi:hypothetical protein